MHTFGSTLFIISLYGLENHFLALRSGNFADNLVIMANFLLFAKQGCLIMIQAKCQGWEPVFLPLKI